MATDFYFHSLRVSNFRAFDELNIESLRRINIFGGFNGVGKTALLETLFFALDRRNPVALIKPLIFRRFDSTGPVEPSQFLKNPDAKDASLEWRTPYGKLRISLCVTEKPENLPLTIDAGQSLANASTRIEASSTYMSQLGVELKTFSQNSEEPIEHLFCSAAPNGMSGTVIKTSSEALPLAQFISISTRVGSKDLAKQISNLIRTKRMDQLIDYMKILRSDIERIHTLQAGEDTQISIELNDGKFLDLHYMGDGFQNLLHAICALMTSNRGIVLLDEIDAAMHYSVITDVWRVISKVAASERCQIFATTHSRECIYSAAKGVADAGNSADFQYIRLEKEDLSHRAIAYTMSQLNKAEEFNAEIR